MTKLASPPNSRNFPRSASKLTDTKKVEVSFDNATEVGMTTASGETVTTNRNVELMPEDFNRTVVTLRNFDDELDLVYSRSDKPNMRTALGSGAGFVLLPGDSIDLEGPQPIFGITDSVDTRIIAGVDFGQG